MLSFTGWQEHLEIRNYFQAKISVSSFVIDCWSVISVLNVSSLNCRVFWSSYLYNCLQVHMHSHISSISFFWEIRTSQVFQWDSRILLGVVQKCAIQLNEYLRSFYGTGAGLSSVYKTEEGPHLPGTHSLAQIVIYQLLVYWSHLRIM